jgi:hypothetical protein
MPVHHFIAQLDRWKAEKKQREIRPGWLTELIHRLAELFEPLHGVARVGFDCRPTEDGWRIGLFLGQTEIVGGPFDGKAEICPFTYDLQALKDEFDVVERFQLFGMPDDDPHASAPPSSFIAINGRIGGQRLTVRVYSLPPEDAGIALKNHVDGRYEPV